MVLCTIPILQVTEEASSSNATSTSPKFSLLPKKCERSIADDGDAMEGKSSILSTETVYPYTSESEGEEVVTKSTQLKRAISSESGDTVILSDHTDESKKVHVGRKMRKIVKTEDDSTPLPDPFPLPKHFPQDVEVALKNKKLSSKEKQKFISEIASSMLRHKRYPSREDYLCVSRSVLQKYPFFKSSDAKPYVSI